MEIDRSYLGKEGHFNNIWYLLVIQIIITARKRNLREGNVFSHVCLFVQRESSLPLLPYGDPPTIRYGLVQTCSLGTPLLQPLLAHKVSIGK